MASSAISGRGIRQALNWAAIEATLQVAATARTAARANIPSGHVQEMRVLYRPA
jgi:hypothetical protein